MTGDPAAPTEAADDLRRDGGTAAIPAAVDTGPRAAAQIPFVLGTIAFGAASLTLAMQVEGYLTLMAFGGAFTAAGFVLWSVGDRR